MTEISYMYTTPIDVVAGKLKRTISIFIVMVFLMSSVPVFCAANMELTLTTDKSEYNQDEPIGVTLKLKNAGDKPVWVNKRFYLGSEQMPKDKRDGYFVVSSASGEKLASKFSYEAGFPKSDYFELLEPGKEVPQEWKRNLRGYYELKEPGTYEVSAVYENTFGPEIGLDTFKDRIESNKVKITIAEKSPKK